MYDILELKKKKLEDLQKIAGELEINELENYKKLDLIYEILDKQALSPNQNEKKPKSRPKKIPSTDQKKENKHIKKEINPNKTNIPIFFHLYGSHCKYLFYLYPKVIFQCSVYFCLKILYLI